MGKRFTPPSALRRPLTSIQHGITRTDDYSWLRASDWHAVLRNPDALPSDIRAHLEAENAYTSAIMADTEALRQQLFTEMKARIKQDDASVPSPDGGFAYYTRFVIGGEHPLFCRVPRGGEEQLLIDGNALAKDHAYFRIANVSHSPNHRLVRAQSYPHILALAGLTDPRTSYWEPAKWVAKLRELKTDNHLLLLHTNMDAGHAGAAGRFERLKEVALAYAFALKIAGV